MATVQITAVRLVDGRGYMMAHLVQNTIRIDPSYWRNVEGEREQYNKYYWLNDSTIMKPRNIIDTNVC